MIGKHGAKLTPTKTPNTDKLKGRVMYLEDNGAAILENNRRHYVNVTLDALIHSLSSSRIHYQNKTGIAGHYDFDLPIPFQGEESVETYDMEVRSGLKAMGLEVRSGKGPAYEIQILYIERPSAN